MPYTYGTAAVKTHTRPGQTENHTSWRGQRHWSPQALLGACEVRSSYARQDGSFSNSSRTTIGPSIPLLEVYLRELRAGSPGICTAMIVTAWITIGKGQKQPGCPSMEEGVQDVVSTYLKGEGDSEKAPCSTVGEL